MAEFRYTTVPGKLPPLFDKIREVGVPPKATIRWLEAIGFKSNNDRTLLRVLEFIGFLNQSREPTEVWKKYRGANHKIVLAGAIRDGYAELFAVYQDAWKRSSDELTSFFSTRTSAGKQVVSKTVNTFLTLCSLADFSRELPSATHPRESIQPSETDMVARVKGKPGIVSPSLHIDVQIHISPDATPEQIDKIFESMGKHIYRLKPSSDE